jgi:hypothetical protein
MGKEIKFGPVTSTADGVLYSAQSSAGRSKKKWLIVRCDDLDSEGEIIFEHNARIEGLCVSPGGVVHAVCNNGFHHHNESGAWSKKRVAKDRNGRRVALLGQRLFISTTCGEVYERVDGAYVCSLEQGEASGTEFVCSFDATDAAIYAARDDGKLFRLAGGSWSQVEAPRLGPCSVLSPSEDEIIVSSYFGLFRGSSVGGLSRLLEQRLQYGARYREGLYVASYSGGISRVEGGSLELVGEGFSVTCLDGAGAYLCATGMASEIQLYDGQRWQQKRFSS